MGDCKNCAGGCGGCSRELTLTEGEIGMLRELGQIPFLPVGRRIDDATPIYLESGAYSQEEYGLILQLLEKKGLITLDFDRPLKGGDNSRYAGIPIVGSMALTARGLRVQQLMDVQGVDCRVPCAYK